MTQTAPSAPSPGWSKQRKYILAIVIVAVIVVAVVAAILLLPKPSSAINANVFLGLATPIYSMIPQSMPYSQSVFKTKYGAVANSTLGANLLTQAGFDSTKNGKLFIDLWYNSDGHYGDTEPSVALVVKTSLEKTGMVIVSLKSEPWAAYRNHVGNGALSFYLLGWYHDYLDADDYAAPFFGTSGAK